MKWIGKLLCRFGRHTFVTTATPGDNYFCRRCGIDWADFVAGPKAERIEDALGREMYEHRGARSSEGR